MMHVEPVTLHGHLIRLEPLRMEHASQIYEASQHPSIWTHMPVNQPTSLTDVEQLISSALENQRTGSSLPFTIISLERNCIVGQTRYLTIVPHDHGLEIGWTWLNPSVQRTGINTECKYLLLRHAFEGLGAIRVQFKTHHNNIKSQQAIERLGAVKEGILRNHMIMPDGSYRHSVYYSIIATEWPTINSRLDNMMHR